jgi:uncharacterized protein (TIGR00730 family)
MRSVCVYCGSRMGAGPAYRQAAEDLGRRLAARGITLVYGGGDVGLMGVLADAAMAAGGTVIGVIPQALMEKEVGHRAVSELIVTPDMHQRKLKMATLADAFIALPGGIGTLEELFETFTWLQLGFHKKPIGLLDVDGYYERLAAFLDHIVAQNFLRADQLAMLHRGTDAEALLDELTRFEAPDTDRWYERSEFV